MRADSNLDRYRNCALCGYGRHASAWIHWACYALAFLAAFIVGYLVLSAAL